MNMSSTCCMRLLLLFFLPFCAATSYEFYNTGTSFEDAETRCEAKGLQLATTTSKDDYEKLIEYIEAEKDTRNDFWIALKKDNGTGVYTWQNGGKALGIVNWATNQPASINPTACVFIKPSSTNLHTKKHKWYTSSCSDKRRVVCETNNGGFVAQSGSATFKNAKLQCNDKLPVLMTKADRVKLHHLIDSELSSATDGVWLGLEQTGSYFEWLNGEDLDQYIWEEKDDSENYGEYVHAHPQKKETNIVLTKTVLQIHAPIKPGKADENYKARPYICQNKTVESPGTEEHVWTHYHYLIQTKNAIVTDAPRKEILVVKKTHCAMECSRDKECYRYTLNGKECKTFSNGSYSTSSTGDGTRLYERIEVKN